MQPVLLQTCVPHEWVQSFPRSWLKRRLQWEQTENRLCWEKISLAKHFPAPTRKSKHHTRARTHTALAFFCWCCCCFHDPPPQLCCFVLQACVQFYSEHGLPLRCDPGQQTLEELGALWAHTPRLLLFHRLQERKIKAARQRGDVMERVPRAAERRSSPGPDWHHGRENKHFVTRLGSWRTRCPGAGLSSPSFDLLSTATSKQIVWSC